MVDVKGKWALVTGANRGIGYRIAKFMASKGCNLILHSRSLEHTAGVLAEVRAMGVEAYRVVGYSKAGDFVPGVIPNASDHAWNAIKVDGNYYVLDATWGIG